MKTNLTYRQWMVQVENEVERVTGLTMDLLPDWTSRDAFDDGLSVQDGVAMCFEQVGLMAYDEQLVDEY